MVPWLPSRWRRDALGRPQLRAPGPRIPAHFLIAGNNRFPGQDSDARVFAAGQGAKSVFDDAILERVKSDDGESRAGAQASDSGFQKTIEAVELAIDPDSQRLKRPGCRINPHRAPPRQRAPND